jgi:hypothetical protein
MENTIAMFAFTKKKLAQRANAERYENGHHCLRLLTELERI